MKRSHWCFALGISLATASGVSAQHPETNIARQTTPSRVIADTEIVRSAGVATDVDDTASTQYGKHQTPRGVPSPACRPRGVALCLRDTARTLFSVDCCVADQRQTNWLVFANTGDSLQLFLEPSISAYLAMFPANAAGAFAETSRGVDASWLRSRFPAAGSYVFTASIESGGPAPYELRVAPVVTTGASQPIGEAATLTLRGARKTRIAIAPRSMMPSSDSARARFAVKPGTYHILLVRDTLYAACALPCVHQTVVALRRGQSRVIQP